eukprot:CAMPEP_0181023250 /NCGR_PEP_ID=MMETSP1070-20121207/1953_1 /TAXON_ID=265543 /ORGANISM="Minutocellus polymorphus, Strain NH13" /LENGTH=716 /DNA_ID=CAMNT_0023100257 /DNA_START=480 /DNA_END=2630 /DNA_ORIENTATION=+
MPARDPFPMQSEEAKRLEASVADADGGGASSSGGSGGAASSWNRMGLGSGASTARSAAAAAASGGADGDGEAGLVPSKGGRKKGGGRKDADASIYDEAELEEAQGGGRPTAGQKYAGADDFLDQSLDDRHGAFAEWYRAHVPLFLRRIFATFGQLAKSVHARLYGDALPPHEMIRTMCLAMTLFFMIGGYWLLRSLKDPVLTALCGVAAIPKAKMLSVFIVLGVVSIYNRLLDTDIPKHRLFYIFGTFYFGLFSIIAVLLSDPVLGLPNQTPDITRVLGWVSYCGIESFGSVMVSLFWSFANSNFNIETAKASYGLLVATAQVGSILGPTIVNRYAATVGVPKVYFCGAICMLLVQASMYLYIQAYGSAEEIKKKADAEADANAPPKKKKEKAGVLEGLHLFAKHNYVKGIFAISCLFMIEVTIVDYTMKVLARDHFAAEHPCARGASCWDPVADEAVGLSLEATAAFTTFMGLFGQATNTLSFLMSLLGTAAVIRTLGLRLSLLLFPSLCLAVIVMVRFYPSLYVVFAAMIILKANSYALNNPTKEMLYQPTAPNVKYKAKSWIDIFGARGSKAMGSVITNAFSDSAPHLIQNGSLVGMAVASFLIFNARFMGRKFDEYMESGYIVGGDNDEEDEVTYDGVKSGVEMASAQNDENDTSCAIPDDDDELGAEEEGQGDEEEEAAPAPESPSKKKGGNNRKKRRGKRQHGVAAVEQV